MTRMTTRNPLAAIQERLRWSAAAMLLLTTSYCMGQNQDRPPGPEPTHANIAYGPHGRHVIDFYQAKSAAATPVLVYFHGGGFRGGDKGRINEGIYRLCMAEGMSLASANYRLSQHARYPAQMHDSARAVQFLRSKSEAWNIDPDRIAAFGGSAGAGISLWLAFHDDMADPQSDDPVARQSSRLACAIGLQAQSTYDPREIKRIVPGRAYDHPALKQLFGVAEDFSWDTSSVDDPLSARLKDASPLTHLTNDDPPVFVYHQKEQDVPGNIHHGNFGRHLKKKMDELGIECVHHMSTDFDDMQARNKALVEFVKKHVGLSSKLGSSASASGEYLTVKLRSRVESIKGSGETQEVNRNEDWVPRETAIIVCDMWDDHTCQGAAGRVAQMAPAVLRTINAAREQGTLIIHAPSGRMSFYADTPQRRRAIDAALQ